MSRRCAHCTPRRTHRLYESYVCIYTQTCIYSRIIPLSPPPPTSIQKPVSLQLIILDAVQHHNVYSNLLSFRFCNSGKIGFHCPQYIYLFDSPLYAASFLPLHTHPSPPVGCPPYPVLSPTLSPLMNDFGSTSAWPLCIFIFNFI